MKFDLSRFVEAQASDYPNALREIQKGRKRSHWMWYIFPQLKGLGHSSTAQYYGLSGLEEARQYLEHPLLGPRLLEITSAVLRHPDENPLQIFGHPDTLKFHSSITLFAQVAGAPGLFKEALDVFFKSTPDEATLQLLAKDK